jgi:hypothetical protein
MTEVVHTGYRICDPDLLEKLGEYIGPLSDKVFERPYTAVKHITDVSQKYSTLKEAQNTLKAWYKQRAGKDLSTGLHSFSCVNLFDAVRRRVGYIRSYQTDHKQYFAITLNINSTIHFIILYNNGFERPIVLRKHLAEGRYGTMTDRRKAERPRITVKCQAYLE